MLKFALPKIRLSVQSILVFVSIIFLLLPLCSLYFLHIYENALLRQTESELISQAAFLSALYKNEVSDSLKRNHLSISHYGIPLQSHYLAKKSVLAIAPTLDFGSSKIYPSRPNPQKNLNLRDPIAEDAGHSLLPILKDAQRLTLSGMKVLNHQGVVAAGQKELGMSFAHTEEFKLALMGYPVSLLRHRKTSTPNPSLNSFSRGGQFNVYVALPVILKNKLIGVIWLNRTPTDIQQSLYNKRWELIGSSLIIIITTLLITLLTGYTITLPLKALVAQTLAIARDDKQSIKPIPYPVTIEIAQLSNTIYKMAQKLQHRNEYIRNFANHVSHEFKTPLTSIRGGIELLQEDWESMPTEKRQRFLQNIASDTQHLNLLVNRLLELAKADMSEAQAQQVPIMPIITTLKQQYEHKNLSITVTSINSSLTTTVTQESIEAILTHLFENSLQAGATEVSIGLEQFSNQLVLIIADNGPGITAGNADKIFTPFFTTRRESGGTGLGLSISQSLLERQGGHIKHVKSTVGACFKLTLPLA